MKEDENMAKAKAEVNEKNTVVLLNLDRPREVRFGHRALKKMSALIGRSFTKINEDELNLEELEKILFCGLLSDAQENGETLKLEDMEDLLDKANSFSEVLTAMNSAFEKTFQETEKQKN
jgi:hypothetical protein